MKIYSYLNENTFKLKLLQIKSGISDIAATFYKQFSLYGFMLQMLYATIK